MASMKQLAGQRFGRLLVTAFLHSRPYSLKQPRSTVAVWEVRCDCGNVLEVAGTDLRRGHTTSCGCYKRETARRTVPWARSCRMASLVEETPRRPA
jgi:hypothetical protein